MKFYQLKEKFLKESWIKTFKVKIFSDYLMVDVFKNEDIKSLPIDCKGIITPEGDLITLNWTWADKGRDNINKFIIHKTIVMAYEGTNKIEGMYDDLFNNKYILVQRISNTKDFALSESYTDNEIEFLEINRKEQIEKCQKKNPDKNFIYKPIYEAISYISDKI